MQSRESGLYGPIKAFSYLSTDQPPKSPSGNLYVAGSSQDPPEETDVRVPSGLELTRRGTYYPPDKNSPNGRPDQYRSDTGRQDQYRSDTGRQDQYRSDTGRQDQYRSDTGRQDQYRSDTSRQDQYRPDRVSDPVDSLHGYGKPASDVGSDGRLHHPRSPPDHPQLFSNFILRGDQDPADTRNDTRATKQPAHDAPHSRITPPQEHTPRDYVAEGNERNAYKSRDRPDDFDKYGRDQRTKQESPYNYGRQLPRTELPPEPDYVTDRGPRDHGLYSEPKSVNAGPLTQDRDFSSPYPRQDEKFDDGESNKNSFNWSRCRIVFGVVVLVIVCLAAGFVAAWFLRPVLDDDNTDTTMAPTVTTAAPTVTTAAPTVTTAAAAPEITTSLSPSLSSSLSASSTDTDTTVDDTISSTITPTTTEEFMANVTTTT